MHIYFSDDSALLKGVEARHSLPSTPDFARHRAATPRATPRAATTRTTHARTAAPALAQARTRRGCMHRVADSGHRRRAAAAASSRGGASSCSRHHADPQPPAAAGLSRPGAHRRRPTMGRCAARGVCADRCAIHTTCVRRERLLRHLASRGSERRIPLGRLREAELQQRHRRLARHQRLAQGGLRHYRREGGAAVWPKCTLGSAPARLLCLLRARLAALGSSALPGRGRPSGRPATASSARASRLQSCRFRRL